MLKELPAKSTPLVDMWEDWGGFEFRVLKRKLLGHHHLKRNLLHRKTQKTNCPSRINTAST